MLWPTPPAWSKYPRRTIVVLITDFYEGVPVDRLLGVAKGLVESGVTLLGLAALDERARAQLIDRRPPSGSSPWAPHVAAMTPGELAEWVAQKVR